MTADSSARGTTTSSTTSGAAGRTSDEADLARLIERIAAADRDAFAELYRRTAGNVHALVRRVLQEDAASAELLEEVYVLVWASARTYDPALSPPENWLLDLAHRCAVEKVRAGSASPVPESILPDLAAARTGTGVEARAADALHLLTPEQAEALELAYLGGSTHAEAARALGVDQSTFRIRVATALSRLRQGMTSAGRTPRKA